MNSFITFWFVLFAYFLFSFAFAIVSMIFFVVIHALLLKWCKCWFLNRFYLEGSIYLLNCKVFWRNSLNTIFITLFFNNNKNIQIFLKEYKLIKMIWKKFKYIYTSQTKSSSQNTPIDTKKLLCIVIFSLFALNKMNKLNKRIYLEFKIG